MISFRIDIGPDPGADDIVQMSKWLIEVAVEMNEMWLRRNPKGRCMLSCDGIKYDQERSVRLAETIVIRTAPELLRTQRGVCVDLVALDIAIRRMDGEDAYAVFRPGNRKGLYHILTAVRTGSKEMIYDPSAELDKYGKYLSGPKCAC